MDVEGIRLKMLAIKKLAGEVLSETEDARVRVFDDGGSSFDRYTVFIGGDVFTMSSHPLSPQGMNQWAGIRRGFPVPGDELRSDQIPPEVREAIEQRRQGG